ncbi:hypothetical protein JTB14_017680 [Gonioctena quinquepunctata]|nr:hypothetical protein JTB14_017680 [Gonioctena quinquepunctata]
MILGRIIKNKATTTETKFLTDYGEAERSDNETASQQNILESEVLQTGEGSETEGESGTREEPETGEEPETEEEPGTEEFKIEDN